LAAVTTEENKGYNGCIDAPEFGSPRITKSKNFRKTPYCSSTSKYLKDKFGSVNLKQRNPFLIRNN
jgi:hypothetical protein